MASQIGSHHDSPEAAHSSIYHAKQLCFQRVEDCVAQNNAKVAAHAQALQQMLQLWAKHSGVDARRGMSLDDRLKDHPDLKTTVIDLLELIEQKTTQALAFPDVDDPENAPTMVPKDDDDVDPEEFLIKQKWRNYNGSTWETVGAAVDMLIELTAMIRKSTVRNSSLPTHFHRPDDYFEEYAKVLAGNWFKDARRSLTGQLGNSVFVRRRQMLYKMKHEEKISYPAADPTPASAESTIAPLRVAETIQGIERLQQTTPRINSPRLTVPIFAELTPSSTNLSQLDRAKLAQRRRRVDTLSGITEGSVSIEETSFSYMYPDPPTLAERQRYGVCPYCSGFLPASKLTKVAWMKHLHAGLQPYVCISEKCHDPVQFFSSSKPWLHHMEKIHGRDWPRKVHMTTWYCDREHDRVEFKSESELRKHLVHNHGSLSDAHVNALVRRNWGVGDREAHICPLCESTPINIVPLMNDNDKASLLFRHIGDHLKALALFSLPSLDIDPASYEQNSSSGAQLPTNDDSKADFAGKNQAVAQSDESLEGSLIFDDDPHSIVDAIDSEATVNKEHISDVPSGLDSALEWKFASAEQEAPELDPVLEILRIGYEEMQQATDSTEPLRKAIRAKAVKSVFGEKPQRFFPNGSLDNLITKESVTRELWVKSSTQVQRLAKVKSLAEFISISARKLFAIVVLLPGISSSQSLQKRMDFFRHNNVTDNSLPLQVSWWEGNSWHGTHIGGTKDDFGSDFENEHLWRHSQIRDFCSIQHWFLAPVFSTTRLCYDLELGTILPFTERYPSVYQSAFVNFVRYRIHRNHIDQQAMDTSRSYYVAVKKTDENPQIVPATWKKQVSTLSHIQSLNHEHIVRFLGAFRRGQQDGHFMFEWANGGNLSSLWPTFHRPKLTSGLVKSAFRQMAGLASAIRMLHGASVVPCTSAGNFNPDHVLLFNNGDSNGNELGTLKIAAWKFRLGPGFPIRDNDHNAKGSWRYGAPEFRSPGLYFKLGSRACDVWSMGCIMLEFLIWLMYGMAGLHSFRQKKELSLSRGAFFYQTNPGAQGRMPVFTVDTVVLEWMDHMAADPACEVGTTALGDLLELIRTRLLVINLSQKRRLAISAGSSQGSVGPHSSVVGQSEQMWERCVAAELDERMQKISDENGCERYWLAAQPKSSPDV